MTCMHLLLVVTAAGSAAPAQQAQRSRPSWLWCQVAACGLACWEEPPAVRGKAASTHVPPAATSPSAPASWLRCTMLQGSRQGWDQAAGLHSARAAAGHVCCWSQAGWSPKSAAGRKWDSPQGAGHAHPAAAAKATAWPAGYLSGYVKARVNSHEEFMAALLAACVLSFSVGSVTSQFARAFLPCCREDGAPCSFSGFVLFCRTLRRC
jgi:hypothetical protein